MNNGDAVAIALCATNSVIDKMVLSVYTLGSEDLKFLAKYKSKLASARTKLSDDFYFSSLFGKYYAIRAGKK